MKTVIQRVRDASVTKDNDGVITGSIEYGLLIYLGVEPQDTADTVKAMVQKIIKLRIFPDNQYKMNLSVQDVGGSVLVVSQFTLCADLKKGNRPSWDPAASPELAKKLYEVFVHEVAAQQIPVATGSFGDHMHVKYENDGPVTILLDSSQLKQNPSETAS